MSGLGRIVVGYRRDERGARHPGAVNVGPCQGCGADVYLVPSGQDAVRDRDAQLVCTFCKDEAMAEL